ncbi:hypothetical protein PHLCEN_2v723 [Hermanssonia centrifuga]|uniref:Uncharacterized protein n=1 Tax=Hermanssonia centrifuga TaxID=98765 RepID=A0A2R6S5C5_9APHY|nr:hypothetical protein PHLCEN_2v723 [Hermanssonia centrifuga]
MGNSSSSGRGHHDDTVDFGYLTPQGIYTGQRDWNQAIVTQFIIDRKLAPFYRPLEDYDESWDDDQILAAMKEIQQPEPTEGESSIARPESVHSGPSRTHHKRPSAAIKEQIPPTWSDASRATLSAEADPNAAMKKRRKSFGADNPDVVSVDQIRPDWEAKLAAIRAAVARRANRRIVMRQVGDRLVPVGITSGRIHALPTEDAQENEGGGVERGSRRSRRRTQNNELNQYLGSMGLGGQDLEEATLRLSLIDYQDQQNRQREEEEKKKKEGDGTQIAASENEGAGASSSTSNSRPTPIIAPTVVTPSAGSSTVTTPVSSEGTMPGAFTVSRSSISLSRNSGELSPETSADGNRWRQRSPSPLGAIGAAMRSATSTASALASPPLESRVSNGNETIATSGSSSQGPLPSLPPANEPSASKGTATNFEDIHPIVVRTELDPTVPTPTTGSSSANLNDHIVEPGDENGAGSPSSDHTAIPSPHALDTSLSSDPRPISERTTSFASSLVTDTTQNPATYDYLPSSPSSSTSSLSQAPLLDGSTSIPYPPTTPSGESPIVQ